MLLVIVIDLPESNLPAVGVIVGREGFHEMPIVHLPWKRNSAQRNKSGSFRILQQRLDTSGV